MLPGSSEDGLLLPEVWKDHRQWLRSVIMARLRGVDAVDDVLHEVLVAAARAGWMPSSSAEAARWLYRVAVRQALLYRRRLARQRRREQQYALRQSTAPTGSQTSEPLALLLADERRKRVQAALHRLPSRDAELLLLKYAHDWSYDQMAMHFGISRDSVKVRLHRARLKLRQLLGNIDR